MQIIKWRNYRPERLLKIYLLGFLSVILMTGCSTSQQSDESSIQVAEEAFSAMSKLDWAAYSQLMHADALEKFRAVLTPAIDLIVPADSLGNVPDSVSIFGGTLSTKQLVTGSDSSFFVSIMDVVFSGQTQLQSTFQAMRNVVVGSVSEGGDVVHVVVRTTIVDPNIRLDLEEVNAVTLKLSGNEWKMMLTTKIRGLADLIAQSLRQQSFRG